LEHSDLAELKLGAERLAVHCRAIEVTGFAENRGVLPGAA
jgi:hypothetical protein